MQNKRKRWNFVTGIMFLAGTIFLLYPAISDRWNSLRQSEVISEYEQMVKEMDSSVYEELLLEAKAYNQAISKTGILWHMTEREEKQYEKLLNINNSGVMGYVEIPTIECKIPIYHGTDEAVLQVAAGHLGGTSLPVGGEGSHCMISGHRGLPSAKLFTHLDQLKRGDKIKLRILNEQLVYEVSRIQVVLPNEIESLRIEEGKDLCTLITCTPYGVNSHRLLVTAVRIENENMIDSNEDDNSKNEEKGGGDLQPWYSKTGVIRWVLLCVFLALICLKTHVDAKVQVNTKEKAAITIQYEKGKTEFSLYKVANVSKTFHFTSTKAFAAYRKQFKYNTAAQSLSLAESLAAYVKKENISPFIKAKTSEEGSLTWKNLSVGLYLVVGEAANVDGKWYEPSPCFIALPSHIDDSVWEYDITVHPKFEQIDNLEPVKSDMGDVLPQTGQLWWPVILMLGTGTFLLLVAFFIFLYYNKKQLYG